MMDLLEKLKSGRQAIAKKTLNGLEFGLRVLSEQDYLAAQLATEAAMKAHGLELSLSTSEAWEAEKTSQLLVRALVDPVSGKPITGDAKALREALLRPDKDQMILAYLEHEREFSPTEANLGDEAFAELLEQVKKNPATPILNDSSFATLKRLIAALASRPAN